MKKILMVFVLTLFTGSGCLLLEPFGVEPQDAYSGSEVKSMLTEVIIIAVAGAEAHLRAEGKTVTSNLALSAVIPSAFMTIEENDFYTKESVQACMHSLNYATVSFYRQQSVSSATSASITPILGMAGCSLKKTATIFDFKVKL